MTLGEICKNVCSGGTPNTSHSDYYGGDIPWLRTQEVDWKDIQDTEVKITKKGVENSSAKWIPANCVIVAMYGATAAKVAINKIPLTTNQACCNLEVNPQIASYRYVFHWLCNNYQNLKSLGQGSQSNINAGTVKSFKIPVPSLAMQEKITNVLDNFDAICSDLNIGLPAEIELRKKQYEYYRDRLLTFNTNVNNSIHGGGNLQDEIKLLQYVFGYAMVRLSDTIISLKTGLNPRQNFKLNIEGNNLPYITGKDIFGNKINVSDKTDRIDQKTVNLINKRACIENDDLLFASTGTGTVGRMAVVYDYANQWAVSETLYCLKPKKDLVLPKFLLFFLSCSDAKNQYEPKISKGSVPHLKVADLLNVAVALPSLNEQNRIVAILDKFDALVNDLSQGIPAEIEARKKQYEYISVRRKFSERLNPRIYAV